MTSAGEHGGAGSRRFAAVLAVLCVVLAVIVVALAVQNLRLKRAASGERHEAPPTLAAGDRVEPLVLVGEGFQRYTLDWSLASRTVLFVFSSTCPACGETQPVWEELAGRLSGDAGVRVIGLQLDRSTDPDGPAPATPASAYPFPVYAIGVDENRAFHELVPFVPATIVLDASGKVLDARFEILDGGLAEEISIAILDRGR